MHEAFIASVDIRIQQEEAPAIKDAQRDLVDALLNYLRRSSTRRVLQQPRRSTESISGIVPLSP